MRKIREIIRFQVGKLMPYKAEGVKDLLSREWLSNKKAAGHRSHKLQRLRKEFEVCSSWVKQFCWSLFGRTWRFHRIWKFLPFSVGMSGFYRSFGVSINTEIKIDKIHDELSINEVYHVIEINFHFAIIITVPHTVNLQKRKRINYKLYSNIERVLHRKLADDNFSMRENLFNSEKSWALSSDRRQKPVRNFTSCWSCR